MCLMFRFRLCDRSRSDCGKRNDRHRWHDARACNGSCLSVVAVDCFEAVAMTLALVEVRSC